jgi:hypothetical protein
MPAPRIIPAPRILLAALALAVLNSTLESEALPWAASHFQGVRGGSWAALNAIRVDPLLHANQVELLRGATWRGRDRRAGAGVASRAR